MQNESRPDDLLTQRVAELEAELAEARQATRDAVNRRNIAVYERRQALKELAEARKDGERKRWMCEQGCYMAHSRDGEDCHLIWPHDPNDEEGGEVVQAGNFSNHDAAIDAARKEKR